MHYVINIIVTFSDYYGEGFLAIQVALSQSILETFGATALPSIRMQRFPYPDWVHNPFFTVFAPYMGLLILIGFYSVVGNIAKAIIKEKEKQIKELMKIMGLSSWLNWTAWFLKEFIFQFILITLITITLTVKWYPGAKAGLFSSSDPLVIFLMLLLYICSLIMFSFAISTIFSKAYTGNITAAILFIVMFAPYFIPGNKLSIKLLASLSFNTAACFGFEILARFESTGQGAHFNNLWMKASHDDNLTLGLVLVFLIIDCLIYLLLTMYLEVVLPGNYGLTQPWYFPFTAKFWSRQSTVVGVEDSSNENNVDNSSNEKEPANLPVGIQIKKLRKSFAYKTAVNDISLNMYEDQIFVLLGHNGAGKTTTISMLTGIIPPSAGVAYISGYNIRTEMWKVRNSLSLCPQDNVLFDDLTVEEHLHFYSKLKGVKDVNSEINKYCSMLELQSKVLSLTVKIYYKNC